MHDNYTLFRNDREAKQTLQQYVGSVSGVGAAVTGRAPTIFSLSEIPSSEEFVCINDFGDVRD